MLYIERPTLLVDKEIANNNIKRIFEKANLFNLMLRPHFKTHQSKEVGRWYRHIGIKAITVSSVSLAEYFVEDGWNDITIAFPINVLEIKRINQLNKKIKLNLLIDNIESLKILNNKIEGSIGVFIKINGGYNRAGIKANDFLQIDELIQEFKISDKIVFKGFLLHSGHTYNSNSTDETKTIHQNALDQLVYLKQKYKDDFPNLILSLGDTPSISICENFEGIDEIRPGNFVFYDVTQYELGSCDLKDIAVCLAAPIISKYADRKEIMIYAGGTHLSKESKQINGNKVCGYLAKFTDDKWEPLSTNNYVKSLSQVHGLITVEDYIFDNLNIGDLIGVLPIHSCMTVNEMKGMLSTTGDIIDVMPPFEIK